MAVQALDTDLDRAHHRRVSLPERAELAAIDDQLATLEGHIVTARAERDAVAERQQALELNLAGVEVRAADVKKRLYGGTVSATRELQAMAAELDSLTARASELENRVLETMEERDPLDRGVDSLEEGKASLLEARVDMQHKLEVREEEVAAEIEALNAARAAAASEVPDDLAKTYHRLRQRLGGVGAARLVGSRCGGCHLTLPATELDHLRRQPPGTLSYCDQCGRILVPTHG